MGFASKHAWASKLWPVGHHRFEDMCALAITGQLGGAQMCELDEHIARCERCRKYFESVAQVSVQVMPLLAEKHAPNRLRWMTLHDLEQSKRVRGYSPGIVKIPARQL